MGPQSDYMLISESDFPNRSNHNLTGLQNMSSPKSQVNFDKFYAEQRKKNKNIKLVVSKLSKTTRFIDYSQMPRSTPKSQSLRRAVPNNNEKVLTLRLISKLYYALA